MKRINVHTNLINVVSFIVGDVKGGASYAIG